MAHRHWRALVALSSALATAHPTAGRSLAGARLRVVDHGRPSGQDATVSLAAIHGVSAALGRAEAGYAVRRRAGKLSAENQRGHLHIAFNPLGATVASRGARVGFGLAGAPAVVPTVSANRVVYGYTGITEWFANGPAGLEQGFTVTKPRAGRWLRVTVAVHAWLLLATLIEGTIASAPPAAAAVSTMAPRRMTVFNTESPSVVARDPAHGHMS